MSKATGIGRGNNPASWVNRPKASAQHRWKAGSRPGSTGHVKVRVGKGHPLADPNGWAYEHLLVWVAAGNQRPAKGYVLHHINEDKSDNRIENLRLMTRAEHSQMHSDAIFTWSAWESAFTRPDGEPEGVPTSISECTLDGKRVGSVMRFGTGRYTAFFPDQPHHSHIGTEARAKGLVEQAAGGSVAPLDPRQIVRALCDSPRAATEEEVRHLVVALADEREGFGTLWQMRQRSLAALTLANARIARLELLLAGVLDDAERDLNSLIECCSTLELDADGNRRVVPGTLEEDVREEVAARQEMYAAARAALKGDA